MGLLLDSFWRAVAYCLRPRVIALSFLPLFLMVALALGLGYYFWEASIEGVRVALEASSLVNTLWVWLQNMGAGRLKMVLAPLIVVFAVTPLIVVVSILIVSATMSPALTFLVAERRFPALERKRGSSLLGGLVWSVTATLTALLALLLSTPLWLLPPLILVLPPLIWGWLTYRVMAFDALSEHASAQERRAIFKKYRLSLLGMGVFCGYLGAAPSLIWASGALFAAAFVILVPLAIWIYMLVFAFSSLWFAHFSLAALQVLRVENAQAAHSVVTGVGDVLEEDAVTWTHDVLTAPIPPR